MEFIKSFRNKLDKINNSNFEQYALEAFSFQSTHNPIYRAYIKSLNIQPENIKEIKKIPFLPIEFFKSHKVVSSEFKAEKIFQSSGTTQTNRSRHYFDDLHAYQKSTLKLFESLYGDIGNYVIIAILPSYQEQGNSSLIAMVDHFISKTKHPSSGYYLGKKNELEGLVKSLKQTSCQVLVIGVTFALLELAIESTDFSDCIIMETGGMKGRGKELIRTELHDKLSTGLNVTSIHSEYGMTELFSQSYSRGEGIFHQNKQLKILVRDINDPLSYVKVGRNGGINVIDLGNIQSCCFIETKDIGKLYEDGTFEVLGRFDNSDIRGCNLMLV